MTDTPVVFSDQDIDQSGQSSKPITFGEDEIQHAPHDFTQEALSGKLAAPAGSPVKLPPESAAPSAPAVAIPRGRGDVSQYKTGYFPPTDIPIQGVKDIAEGYQGFSGLPVPITQVPAARGQMPRPVAPKPQVSPEDQAVLDQQANQRAKSAAKIITGAGEVGSVMVPGAAAAAPVSVGVGLGTGYLASKAAGAAVHGKVSPEAEDLVRAVAQFIPSAAGVASGLKTGTVETPQGRFSAASIFGGRAGAGVRTTPEGTFARVKVGGTTIEVPISRNGSAPAPAESPAPAAPLPAGVTSMVKANAAEAMAKNVVAGRPPVPPPPAPPPTPGEQFGNKLSGDQVDHLAKTIAEQPEAKRNGLIEEAHQNLTQWVADNKGKVIIDGKVHIAKTPDQAETLAAKLVNDAVAQHDKATAEAAKVQVKPASSQQPAKSPQEATSKPAAEVQRFLASSRPASTTEARRHGEENSKSAKTVQNPQNIQKQPISQAAPVQELQAPTPKPVQASLGNEAAVVPPEPQTTQNLTSDEVAKQEVAPPKVFSEKDIQPAHEYASTQVNIEPKSELGKRHAEAVAAMPDEHIGPNGKEETPHVTVRYGLKDDSPEAIEKIKAAAAKIAPFEATVGKTGSFPATKEGDHPIIAQVEKSPELNALRSAVEGAGEFKPDDHGEYKPHVTLGYVKPEHVAKYEGGNHLEGGKVPVDHIVVSKRDGTTERIPLAERRTNTTERKRVADMNPEEMARELHTSRLDNGDGTHTEMPIPNGRAFHDAPASPAVAMSDSDGLKAFNDKFGYKAGNAILVAKGEAAKEAGLDAYHQKGDEFLYHGESPEHLKAGLEKARDILRNREFTVTDATGKQVTLKGVDFSYGTGTDLATAESGLKAHKQQREDAGERARGELRGITQVGHETAAEGGSESAPDLEHGRSGAGTAGSADGKALADQHANVIEFKPRPQVYKTSTQGEVRGRVLEFKRKTPPPKSPAAHADHSGDFIEATRLEATDPKAAMAIYDRLVKDSSNPEITVPSWVNRGVLLYNERKYTEAIDSYQRALEVEPHHALGRYNLANALEDSGQTKEAVPHYEQAIKDAPSWADPYYNLARLQQQLRNNKQALEMYRAFLKRESTGPFADAAHIQITRLTDYLTVIHGKGKAAKQPVADGGKPALHVVQPQTFHESDIEHELPEGVPAKGKSGEVPTGLLHFDPKRFQYKLNVNEKGVTNLLHGQKFNQDLAGVVSVWHDPEDGKLYVVNGHHRAQLAKETGQKELLVRHLDVATAGEARAVGALQNIAEGRGTAIDAAKFFRDRGISPEDLSKHGISLGEAKAADGLALSKLDESIFEKVATGKMSEGRGVAIGQATTDPAQREAIVKLLDKREKQGKNITDAMVAELARFVGNSGNKTIEQGGLFGANQQIHSLALEKAEISAHIKGQIAKERRVFGSVASEDKAAALGQVKGQKLKAEQNKKIADAAGQAEEAYNKLSSHAGPVNDILEKSAKELASGYHKPEDVKSRAYRDVRDELRKAVIGSEGQSAGRVQEHSGHAKEDAGNADRQASVKQPSALEELRKPKHNPDEPVLPGMEPHLAAEKESIAAKQGEDLSREIAAPKESISAKAGEMERNSPLFRDTEASGQSGLFNGDKIQDVPADKGAGSKPSATLQPVEAEDELGKYQTFGDAVDVRGNWKRLKQLPDDAEVVLYHATTEDNAKKILVEGFKRGDKPTNFGGDRDYTYLGGYEGHGLGSYIGGASQRGGKPVIVVTKVKKSALEPDHGSDWKSHFRSNPSDKSFAKQNGMDVANPSAVDTYAIINQVRARNEHVQPLGIIDPKTREFTPKSDTTSRPQSGGISLPAKGDTVTLADGREGTVQYVHPEMNIARVKTGDGKTVTVGLKSLKDRSGEAGFAKLDIPSAVADLVKAAHEKVFAPTENRIARGVDDTLYQLGKQYDADVLRTIKLLKSVGPTTSPEDQEAIYHHKEDQAVPLTDRQENTLESVVQPLMDANSEMRTKLNKSGIPMGQEEDGYIHRVVQGKNNPLERAMIGKGGTGKGNVLSKAASSLKGRTMLALEDDAGERMVISRKAGRIVSHVNGHAEDIGPDSNITTVQGKANQQIAKVSRKIAELKRQQTVLKSVKGRVVGGQSVHGVEPTFKQRARLTERIDGLERRREELQNAPDGENKIFTDSNGKQWNLTQATTKEIEEHTGVRYYKNALANTVVDYLQLRRAERANDALEGMKADPEFKSLSFKPEHGEMPPDGWRTVNLPQFNGYYFEPHMAETLDRFADELRADPAGAMEKIGNLMTASLVLNPARHVYNIGNHWLVERGVTGNFNPLIWPRSAKAGIRAIKAVMTQNDDFVNALDHGAPMMSHRQDLRELHQHLVDSMLGFLQQHTDVAAKIAELGGHLNHVDMLKGLYKLGQKMTWMSNDMFFLQSIYEKELGGMKFDDAAAETAKHIPDYRIPSRVLNSPGLSKFMNSHLLTVFSRYHYGVWKSYGQMLKEVAGAESSLKDRGKGLDHMLMLGLLTFVGYELWDKLLKHVTGDPKARMVRSGASAVPYLVNEIVQGNKPPEELIQGTFTPAVLPKTAAELAFNRDLYSGSRIYDRHDPAATIAHDVGKKTLGALGPSQQAEKAERSDTPTRDFLAYQGGVTFPNTEVQSPAVRLMHEILRENMTLTPELQRQLDDKRARIQSGNLTQKERKTQLKKEALDELSYYLPHVARYSDVKKVFNAATPEEKEIIRPIMLKKAVNVMRNNPIEGEREGALQAFEER